MRVSALPYSPGPEGAVANPWLVAPPLKVLEEHYDQLADAGARWLQFADPEVWVMTPGRGDVFGFVMNKRLGFFYPWPDRRPLLLKDPGRAARAEEALEHARGLRRGQPREPVRLVARKEGRNTPARFDAKAIRRALESKAEHVADVLDPAAVAAYQALVPADHSSSPNLPNWVAELGSEHDGAVALGMLAGSLSVGQRLHRALAERARYVIPGDVHPAHDLAPIEEEASFHIDRVAAPHSILAWDRHYADARPMPRREG
ncbi:MAG: hypothetical protein AAF658_11605 [Myxococcota bacterium]